MPLGSTQLLALALTGLIVTPVHAGQEPVLSTIFRQADTVVVATVESRNPVPVTDPRARIEPLEPVQFAPVSPCELSLRIAAVIKTKSPSVRPGVLTPVLSYLPSPTCVSDTLGDGINLGDAALWFLRTDRGALRTLVDNRISVRRLASFSPEIEQNLKQWQDPKLALTYLVLKPGVIIPESEYAQSSLRAEVIDVAGWFDFLKVYRAVYMESTRQVRDEISLAAASFGHCVSHARDAANTQGRLAHWVPSSLLLNPQGERISDLADLSRLSWTTKEQLLAAFETPKAAIDELVFRACSSEPQTSAKARELLLRYFDLKASDLPCIPCE